MEGNRPTVNSRLRHWIGTTTLADLLSPGGAAVRLAGELVAAGACLALIASLFLPWYELPVAFPLPGPEGSLQLPRPDGSLTGWEAFRVADVLLALLAGAGLVFLVTARALGLPVLCALTAAAGWGAVAVVLYGHFRPSALGAVGSYSAPPSFGFFVALCAGGGMLLGSQLAFVAAWASGMQRPIS